MTSSTLAALLAIAAGFYIWFSGQRIVTTIMVLMFVTLGYISGSSQTAFGGWISGIVNGVTTFVTWVGGAF